MKPNYWTILTAAVLLTLSQATWAVRPAGSNGGAPSVNTSGVIERGGMITSIDAEHKTLGVDGVSYTYPASSVILHSDARGAAGNNLELKQGMLIRFNTGKEKYKDKEVVSEIWITVPRSQTPKK